MTLNLAYTCSVGQSNHLPVLQLLCLTSFCGQPVLEIVYE